MEAIALQGDTCKTDNKNCWEREAWCNELYITN